MRVTSVFQSVLRQDVAWHEENPAGTIVTQMSYNIDQIEEGIGGHLSTFIRDMATFFAGMVVAFSQGWKLSLVALAMMLITAAVFTALALVLQLYTKVELAAFERANNIASEVLSAVKTVFQFGGEEDAARRYNDELGSAQKAGVRRNILIGASE